MLRIHKVVGDSMSPTMQSGDYVLSACWWRIRYQINDIVIVKHAFYGVIIKRISQQKPNGEVLLTGDNVNNSTSNQQLGWQLPSAIIGKSIFHISKPHRK